jgi:ankyrin repeat protein
VKNSEYSIVEQLSKTPAKISLLSLILHSDLHRKALLRVLNESHISSNASVAQVERLVGQIQAPNYLTFSDEELGPEGRGHNKPLSIAVSYKDFHVTKVLVDNGSYINVLPKSTFDSLNIDPLYVRETDTVAKAFNGSKVTATGELELPIKIGPHVFNIDFHIMDTRSSYTMLSGLESPPDFSGKSGNRG